MKPVRFCACAVFLMWVALAVAAQVPEKEYTKDAGTQFLCHFNSAEEVKALGGDVAGKAVFVPGKYGNGILCATAGDYVTFPAQGAISFKEGTLEMWVKPEMDLKDVKFPDEPHPYLFHVFKGNNDPAMYIYYNAHNQTIAMSISTLVDGKIVQCYPQASAMDWKKGQWHHVAFTWGKGAFIYFDGKMVATMKFEGKDTPLPERFFVGATAWRSNPARMVIDELRILPVQLSFGQAEAW